MVITIRVSPTIIMATPTGITATTTISVIIAGTGTITIKKSAGIPSPCFRERLADLDLLVHRLLNPLGFVVFKMGRLRGGRKEHIWIDT